MEQPKHFEPGENSKYDAFIRQQSELKKRFYERAKENDERERLNTQLMEQISKQEVATQKAREAWKRARKKLEDLKAKVRTESSWRRAVASAEHEAAVASGAAVYVTGFRCRHGHIAARYTASGACVECDRRGWAKTAEPLMPYLPPDEPT